MESRAQKKSLDIIWESLEWMEVDAEGKGEAFQSGWVKREES